jgi:hypothetical protein
VLTVTISCATAKRKPDCKRYTEFLAIMSAANAIITKKNSTGDMGYDKTSASNHANVKTTITSISFVLRSRVSSC